MTWYAKPSGPYGIGSTEWVGNYNEIYGMLSGSWTDAAIAGMIGNMQHESGLNPWRWQNDYVAPLYDNGYGLPQFTPASGYLALPGTTPNMSTSQTTTGATPADGARQIQAINGDELSKWVSKCWRDYWSPIQYSQLYAYSNQILNTWGNGTNISMSQFKACTDVDAAAFIWLACYEGPKVPNYATRKQTSEYIYQNYMGGVVPPSPDPPTPPTPSGEGVPYWLLKKAANNARRI